MCYGNQTAKACGNELELLMDLGEEYESLVDWHERQSVNGDRDWVDGAEDEYIRNTLYQVERMLRSEAPGDEKLVESLALITNLQEHQARRFAQTCIDNRRW